MLQLHGDAGWSITRHGEQRLQYMLRRLLLLYDQGMNIFESLTYLQVPFLGSYFNTIMPVFILLFGSIFAVFSLFKLKSKTLTAIK